MSTVATTNTYTYTKENADVRLSRWLYLASRTTRDAEVVSGRRGGPRLAKRVGRRAVTRRVGRLYGKLWRW